MNSISAFLKFWGVRGSIASGPSEYGSHTSCVELDLGQSRSIFFDAGTGIRVASSGSRKFKEIILCLSHFHWDHIQGLPFMKPLIEGSTMIKIISGFKDTKERLEVLFDNRFHPVKLEEYLSNIKFHTLEAGQEIKLENLEIDCAPLNHPGKSYAFRVKSNQTTFCYATDSDYDPLEPEAERLLESSDFAIMDSQFLIGDSLAKAEYGHASFKQAIDVAASLNIRNCILYHFDPNYSDEDLSNLEKQSQNYVQSKYESTGLQVFMAKEGLKLPIIF